MRLMRHGPSSNARRTSVTVTSQLETTFPKRPSRSWAFQLSLIQPQNKVLGAPKLVFISKQKSPLSVYSDSQEIFSNFFLFYGTT